MHVHPRLIALGAGLVLIVLPTRPAPAARVKGEGLLRIVTPVPKSIAVAHPFVNVKVLFGKASNGAAADPATFRARLGRKDITDQFADIVTGGVVVGKRARLLAPPLRVKQGRKRLNKLRFRVRSAPSQGRRRKRRLRDKDRVRFRVIEGPDQVPMAQATASAQLVTPGATIDFDGSQSTDPDGDELAYAWDFGDGTSGEGPTVSHTFAPTTVPAPPGTLTVRLTVSDGAGGEASDAIELWTTPAVDPGKTPGTVKVEGTGPLDFAAVAVGTVATRSLTVTNTDTTATSQLRFVVASSDPAFTTDPDSEVTLGPGESRTVKVTFSPSAAGHAEALLSVVATAINRQRITLLAHGYGGPPGKVPLGSPDPAFFIDFFQTMVILPDGTRLAVDNSTGSCGNGDPCLSDGDCPQGDTCMGPLSEFDPSDNLCADGHGGLYILGEDVRSDPNAKHDPEWSTEVLRIVIDPVTGALLDRGLFPREGITSGTAQIACDRRAHDQNGKVYVTRYHIFTKDDDRDGEQLVTYPKDGTGRSRLRDGDIAKTFNIRDVFGELDFEETVDLEVSREAGTPTYAFVSNTVGLYRERTDGSDPLFITPDIYDVFAVHPDGSVVVVDTVDSPIESTVRVFKLSLGQQSLAAQTEGGIRLADYQPCGTFSLPSNGGRSLVTDFAVDSSGTIFVGVIFLGDPNVMPGSLYMRGTLAFTSPASSPTCTPAGFRTLELLDMLTF